MLQQMATAAARDSWKPRAQRQERVALPEPLARLVPLRLLADCSVKAAGAVVVALVAPVVRAVRAVAAQAAVVARVAAAHTQQVLAALVEMAGHWYWSFDHAAICCC